MMTKMCVWALFFLLASVPCRAEEDFSTTEEKAQKAHELAASDVIYEQHDIKALYYQNQRIIELLEEIKDEIHEVNTRAAKDEKK